MRIGFVIPGGIDPSGRERVIPALLWLVERLARHHEIHVFSLRQFARPRTFSLLGAEIHDLGLEGRRTFPGTGLWSAKRRLKRAIRLAGPFDLLHAFWADTPGFLATGVGRDLSVPVLVSLGGGEFAALPEIGYGGGRGLLGRFLGRTTLRRAARVTAASEGMRETARRYGVEAELVPLGVDTTLFPGEPERTGPPWRLLHVAHLNRVKDQSTLLHAFSRVVAEEPAVHLDVIGEDTLSGEIQALSRRLGLGTDVTFHGFLGVDEIAPFYRNAHLLVHSSLHEAGPVVLLEAAAAGLATVGTAVGSVADLAPDRAVAVPVRDPSALAAAILALLRDSPRRTLIASRAQAWARAHDADFTARRFEEIYVELVSS